MPLSLEPSQTDYGGDDVKICSCGTSVAIGIETVEVELDLSNLARSFSDRKSHVVL